MTEFVVRDREREERIEKIVAVVSTVLVAALFALTAGLGLVEGVLAYAIAGGAMFALARRIW